jgi:hypothetical protein
MLTGSQDTMTEARFMTGSRHFDKFLKKSHNMGHEPLRHRTRHLWLLAFYVPLIVVPRALTCVLAQRPLHTSSYTKQKDFLDNSISTFRNREITIDVLNTIAALVTIPFLSALLAQAAVVFTQRRQDGEILILHDLFLLADREW